MYRVKITLARVASRGSFRRGGGLGAAAGLLLLAVALSSCASGTARTSAGPRPAAEVQAQNAVGDILQGIDDGYRAAVALHNAGKGTTAPDVYASEKRTLDAVRAGLVGSWQALAAWKTSTSGGSAGAVMASVRSALGAFLELAVRTGAMRQSAADAVLAFVGAMGP